MEEIKIINQSYTRARDLTIVCYTEIAIQISWNLLDLKKIYIYQLYTLVYDES
jgi:glutamate formiminotransferase